MGAYPAVFNVSFAPGESSKTITLGIVDDNIAEFTETFTVSLSNPNDGSIRATGSTGTGTILDNEPATLSVGDAIIVEGGNQSIFGSILCLWLHSSQVILSFSKIYPVAIRSP